MSNNYPTSSKKHRLGKNYRYLVTYEDEELGITTTYGVWAAIASEATARVITFIKEKNHHISGGTYILYPVISKEKADFEIN